MKKILGFLALLVMGSISTAWGVTVSSTTPNVAILPYIYLQPHESLTYSLTGTATGTALIQVSRDGVNFSPTGIKKVATGAVSESGVITNGEGLGYFRFYVSTITAGSFITSLTDNDDFVAEFRSNKKAPNFQVYDESFRMLNRLVAIPGPQVIMSSTTALNADNMRSVFNVLNSTGGAISISATPTISVTDFPDGTIFIIQSATATVTLSDNGTVTGSLLELGANTRALGVGDILGLILRDGKWWELFFDNN